jgi:hypothetical protein
MPRKFPISPDIPLSEASRISIAGGQFGYHQASDSRQTIGYQVPDGIAVYRRTILSPDEFRQMIRADAINYFASNFAPVITLQQARAILGVHATKTRLEEQNWRTWRPFVVEPVSDARVRLLAQRGEIRRLARGQYDLASVVNFAIRHTPTRIKKRGKRRNPASR